MRTLAATLLFAAAYAQSVGNLDSFELELESINQESTKFLSEKSAHDEIIEEIMAEAMEQGLGRSLQGDVVAQITGMLKQTTAKMPPDQRREFLEDFQKQFDQQMAQQALQMDQAGLPPAALKQAKAQMASDTKQINLFITAALSDPHVTQSPKKTANSTIKSTSAGQSKKAKGSSTASWFENGANGNALMGFTQRISFSSQLASGNVIQSWLELNGAANNGKGNVYSVVNLQADGKRKLNGSGCGAIKSMQDGGSGAAISNIVPTGGPGCSLMIQQSFNATTPSDYVHKASFGIVDPSLAAVSPKLQAGAVLKAGQPLKTRHGFNLYESAGKNGALLDSYQSDDTSVALESAYALQAVVATTVAAVVLTQF